MPCVCLSMISLTFVVKMSKSYYLQVFIEECKICEKDHQLHWSWVEDSFDKFDNSGALDKENTLRLNNESLNQSQIF